MRIGFLFAASLLPASARLIHSLPEDTYAFPKFRVAFLNSLPVLNETAERWLKEGLLGGELEFLDKPWRDTDRRSSSQPKEIGPGEPHHHTPISTIDDVCPSPSTYRYNSDIILLVATNPCFSKLYLGTHENGAAGLVHLSNTETFGHCPFLHR